MSGAKDTMTTPFAASVAVNDPAMNSQAPTNGHAPQLEPEFAAGSGMSADEIALYDRQIRLWGVKAQEKMRNANILIITMKALANEIAKNLVLAGIGSLTILDHEVATERDLAAQFFLAAADVGSNRAEAAAPRLRRLNPRVKVTTNTEIISAKSAAFYSQFDVVIATDLDPDTLNFVNTATRVNHKPFYAAGVYGFYGYVFSDLIQHSYSIERQVSNRTTTLEPETRTRSVIHVSTKVDNGQTIEMVTKQELYSTWLLASDLAVLPQEYLKSRRRLKVVTPLLSCLRALWAFEQVHGRPPANNHADLAEFTTLATTKHRALSLPPESLRAEFLRSFLQNLGTELSPVCAVLGGQLAQDVINVLGSKQQPIQNFVLFDGDSMSAPMYSLHPIGDLGEALLPASNAAEANGMAGILPAMEVERAGGGGAMVVS